jgi:hypothetical protein
MKFNDFIVSEEKVRLDPKCWTGKKIGNPKTKVKGGVRVNNCVPAESVEEAANPAQQAAIAIAKKKKAGVDEAAPPGAKAERMVKHIKKGYAKDGKLSDKEKSIAYATAWKAHNKGVTEAMRPIPVDDQGNRIPDRMSSAAPNRPFGQPGDSKSSPKGVVTYTPTGIVHRSNHGDVTPRPRAVPEGSQQVDSLVTDALKIMRGSDYQIDPVRAIKTVLGEREYNSRRGFYNFYVKQLRDMYDQEGLAEGVRDLGYDAQSLIMKLRRDVEEKRLQPTRQAVLAAARELAGDMAFAPELLVQQVLGQGMAEGFNGEYDDEAGMAQGNLYTIAQAAQGLLDTIDDRDNLPEWAQEKIAKVEGMLVSVWNYLQSQKAQGIDPEINEMYEAMDQLAEEMAAKKGISADLVWESFEALDDNMLYETAAWRRKEGKSKKGGLNAKGVASYRRENPGSKLQTAVTTKPSKLKPGSKAAKRRKSFCARMSGVKGPAKKPNGKPTRKTLALRKWNC